MRTAAALVAGLLAAQAGWAQDPDDLSVRVREAMRRSFEATQPRLVADDLDCVQAAQVALVLLDARQVTDEEQYLPPALGCARLLAQAQLASGGWSAGPAPVDRTTCYLRSEAQRGLPPDGANQSHIAFTGPGPTILGLLAVLRIGDETGDVELRQAADYGLRALLQAQLGNGGWPTSMPPGGRDPQALPAGEVVALLAEAGRAGREWVGPAALRGGEFLLRTQGPLRPGWSAFYASDLTPRDAVVDAAATSAAVRGLSGLLTWTGDERWREPLRLGAGLLRDGATDQAEVRSIADRALLGRPPSRPERVRWTGERIAAVTEILEHLHSADGWPGVDAMVADLRALNLFLRDYELPPDLPGEARPPQHRR